LALLAVRRESCAKEAGRMLEAAFLRGLNGIFSAKGV